MLADFRHRVHPRGVLFNTIERAFLGVGATVLTLVALLILFFVVYLKLA
jgi:hypothetical protein